MLILRDTGLGPWGSLALFAATAVVCAVVSPWWLAQRRKDSDRLVDDGVATWAALGLIQWGARHLGGELASPLSKPHGILSVSGGDLVWQPNKGALRRRHIAVRRPLAQVEVVKGEWRRPFPSIMRYCELQLRFEGHNVLVYVFAEAGVEPAGWRARGR